MGKLTRESDELVQGLLQLFLRTMRAAQSYVVYHVMALRPNLVTEHGQTSREVSQLIINVQCIYSL